MDEYTDLTTIVNETSSGKLESDPSAFYIGIAACTLMSSLIVLVNLYFCCFNKYLDCWKDSHDGEKDGDMAYQT